jgi:TfoX/Sxy family transcriptional regulator of competence genes
MTIPKSSEADREWFHSLLPDDPRVAVRPMFGCQAAFINGNMFTGLMGSSLFVRLSEAEREELLAVPGAAEFMPMEGRPMKEYVTLPEAWREDPEQARAWVRRSLEWAATLPAKAPKPPRKRR